MVRVVRWQGLTPGKSLMMMTNAAAMTGIVSRVSEIAGERGLRGLGITPETDGTTTFQPETGGERSIASLRPWLSAS